MGATFNSGNPTRPQSRRPEGHIERRSQTERRSQDAPERFRRGGATPNRAEDLLKALAADLGLAHALDLLQRERARITAILAR